MSHSRMVSQTLLLCAAVLLATTVLGPAADDTRGAVELSDGTVVPQNPSLPTLHLNDEQREQIRQALLTKNTEVEFKLSTTKSAEDFTPKIDAMLPPVVRRTAFRRS
jgi:membrane-associated HD superfamily phosphohydrolase